MHRRPGCVAQRSAEGQVGVSEQELAAECEALNARLCQIQKAMLNAPLHSSERKALKSKVSELEEKIAANQRSTGPRHGAPVAKRIKSRDAAVDGCEDARARISQAEV